MDDPVVFVVGIGADGWTGLSAAAQHALREAGVVVGSGRQLGLLGPEVRAERVQWRSPLLPALPEFLATYRGRGLAVLSSGDPMFYGIGSTLVRLLGQHAVAVLPSPSSMSLACARLGWPVEDVDVVSLVGRRIETVIAALQPGRRLLVLVSEPDSTSRLARLLTARGYGASGVTVLEQLGGPRERIGRGIAGEWDEPGNDANASNARTASIAIVAVDCVADAAAPVLPRCPGLPDDAFEHDGQITKREVRAMTLAALAPVPGQLLWDIGAGSGSIGIEWMRTHPACRAIAVEPREDRRDRITRNADSLGVPGLQVVAGSAPDALACLPQPDAIFIGGGIGTPGVLETCLAVLPVGGRLVANAVTVESEGRLADMHRRVGGSLTRVAVQHAEPLGRFSGWHARAPVTQWGLRKSAP